MADSSKISFFLFLFTFFFSRHIYARESQFFNKIPSNNNNVVVDKQPRQEDPLNKPDQEPTFIPENESGGYGLYGHESGQLPPTTTTTTTNPTFTNTNNDPNGFLPKYLPKNYNTESYVTEAEGYTQPKTTSNSNYNTGNAYYRDQSQGYSATSAVTNGGRFYPTNNYDANRYNGQQESLNQYKLGQKVYNTNADNSNYYNSNVNSAEKQGMSDTRFMENGRYFYDISLENNNRYPFDNTRTENVGYYGNNNENSHEFNRFSNEGFQNQGEQFQEFEDQRFLP